MKNGNGSRARVPIRFGNTLPRERGRFCVGVTNGWDSIGILASSVGCINRSFTLLSCSLRLPVEYKFAKVSETYTMYNARGRIIQRLSRISSFRSLDFELSFSRAPHFGNILSRYLTPLPISHRILPLVDVQKAFRSRQIVASNRYFLGFLTGALLDAVSI